MGDETTRTPNPADYLYHNFLYDSDDYYGYELPEWQGEPEVGDVYTGNPESTDPVGEQPMGEATLHYLPFEHIPSDLDTANYQPSDETDIDYRPDIEHMYFWVAGMSDEYTAAHAAVWRRASALLETTASTMRARADALRSTWEGDASAEFLAWLGATVFSAEEWQGIASNNAYRLEILGPEIRDAQQKMRPLYAHYRGMEEQWRQWREAEADPDGLATAYEVAGFGFASSVTMPVNHPDSEGWNPTTSPQLPPIGWANEDGIEVPTGGPDDYNSTGSAAEGFTYVSNERDVVALYQRRAAEIIRPLAQSIINQHYNLSQGRQFAGPREMGMPSPVFDPSQFTMPSMPDLQSPNVSVPDVPMPNVLTPDVPVAPMVNGSMPGMSPALDPGAMFRSTDGFLAGAPGMAGVGPGLLPAAGLAPQQAALAQQAAQQAALTQQATLAQQAALAQQAGLTAQRQAALQAAQAARGATLGAAPAGAPGRQPAAAPGFPPGVAPAGVSPLGVALPGLTNVDGLGPVPADGLVPLTAAGEGGAGADPSAATTGAHGALALPGATAGPQGGGWMMPPPPPPMVPPMAGQQQAGRQGGQAGQPAGAHVRGVPPGMPGGPPPMFVPPGRTTQPGRTPTAPQRVPSTLAGTTTRAAARATGLRGVGASGAAPAAPAQPAPHRPTGQAAPPERVSVPGENDRELWTVKKPKGVLQGSGPHRPAPHGKPIGSAG